MSISSHLIIIMIIIMIMIVVVVVVVVAAAAAAAVVVVVVVIALKGANQDFYNLLTAPRPVSNTYAQVARV